ncbi:MAG: DUF2066 domain-containing protein [Alphaproteobacteria bacterium]
MATVHDLFTVRNIAVDKTAATATAAREAALAEAQVQGLRILLERLTTEADRRGLPTPKVREVFDMVTGVEIQGEKLSGVRYIGTVTVSYRPDDVRRLLLGVGIPFAEIPSRPIVVLPLFTANGKTLLWSDANLWKKAWDARSPDQGLIPFVVPVGDLEDLGTISPEQAQAAIPTNLEAIAKRYGAADALIAELKIVGNQITASAVRIGPVSGTKPIADKIVGTADTPDALGKMVTTIIASAEEIWKQSSVTRSSQQSDIEILIPTASLEEWTRIRGRINAVSSVRRMRLVSLSKRQVRLAVNFVGSVEQLRIAMAQNELGLEQENGEWTINPKPHTDPAAATSPTTTLPVP